MYDNTDRKDMPVALRTARFCRDDDSATDGMVNYLPNIQQLLNDIATELSIYEERLSKAPRDNSRKANVSTSHSAGRWSMVVRHIEPIPNSEFYVSSFVDRDSRQANLARRSEQGCLTEIFAYELPEIVDMEHVITGLRTLNTG